MDAWEINGLDDAIRAEARDLLWSLLIRIQSEQGEGTRTPMSGDDLLIALIQELQS